MQTLLEALEANSLEHKLEMQIKAALEEGEQINEKVELVDKITFPNKLTTQLFPSQPREYEMSKINTNLKSIFGISYLEYHIMSYLN